MSIELNKQQFWERAQLLHSSWLKSRDDPKSGWGNVDSWSFVVGKAGDSQIVSNMSDALILYLLGYTFTDTLMVFTKDCLYMLASVKKLKLLGQLSTESPNGSLRLELLEKNKEQTEANFNKVLEKMKSSFDGKTMGFFKDQLSGSFAPTWEKALMKDFPKPTDLTEAISLQLSQNTPDQLENFKGASKLASRLLKVGCVKRMEDIIDEEVKISHKKFSEEVEEKVLTPAKIKVKLEPTECEVSTPPLIQSGGKYDFKTIGISSNTDTLKYDCIVFSLGVKYRDYNAMMARTYFIDPTKKHEEAYKALLKVKEELQNKMKPGVVIADAYAAAVAKLTTLEPKLVPHLTATLGWSTGILFRSPSMIIKSDNRNTITNNSVWVIRLGLTLEGFSCLLCDTVVVNNDGCVVMTKGGMEYGDVMYKIAESGSEGSGEDEEEEEEVIVTGDTKLKRSLRSSHKTKADLRQEENAVSLAKEIEEHQKKLMSSRALERSGVEVAHDESDSEEQIEITKRYNATDQYPSEMKRNQIYCDKDKECVLLPLFGYHVPFHISCIKSVSKSDEENSTFLRLNLFYPTGSAGFSRDTPAAMRAVLEQHPSLFYMKEVSFKSRDSHNLNHQLRLIKELQKRVRLRQKKKETEADLVEQQDLIPDRSGKKPTLMDISMRPSLNRGKSIGRLSAHTNGFRFRTNRGETFDIIYANIKHFIYQPCEKELSVLIHFRLQNPVMVGRTKTHDIQFYAEVVDGSTALDQRRRTMYDPDEIDEENRERLLKKRLNSAFKSFCNQVIQVVEKNGMTIGQGNEYDIPYRALGFNGVPFKEMVFIQPTVNCLVNLTETPPLVISLDEVEHIHMERTDFRVSKTFDIVFVLKKHLEMNNHDVPQRIQSIPVDKFDTIKQWIHEKGDITFTCGMMSLNWKIIMTGVKEELERGIFWNSEDLDGEKKAIGWNFLALDEDEDEEEQEDDEESEFEASSEEEESESDDWDVDEESSEAEADESEEEGADWDELHREAAKEDKVKTRRERDAGEGPPQPKKKKRRRH